MKTEEFRKLLPKTAAAIDELVIGIDEASNIVGGLIVALEKAEAYLARQEQTVDCAGVLGEIQAALAKAREVTHGA